MNPDIATGQDSGTGTEQPFLPGLDVARNTVASPSALERYRLCPRQYRFLYVDRLREFSRTTPQQAFGTAVHAALREFFRTPPARRDTALLHRAFRKAWAGEGGGTGGDRERGMAVLSDWHRRAVASGEAGVVPSATEVALTATFGDVLLKGRLDRVDRVPGGLRVVDYKTGARPPAQEHADADLALTVYAALVTRKLGQPVTGLVLDYVVPGVQVVTTRPPALLAERLAEVLALAAGLRDDTEYRPRTGPWCRRCDFLRRCPSGQAEVLQTAQEDDPA